jgi:hypothetical protein
MIREAYNNLRIWGRGRKQKAVFGRHRHNRQPRRPNNEDAPAMSVDFKGEVARRGGIGGFRLCSKSVAPKHDAQISQVVT